MIEIKNDLWYINNQKGRMANGGAEQSKTGYHTKEFLERNYGRLNTVYKEREISSELGVVIGAITQSQRLINQALEMEQKGGRINMCSALEELEKKAEQGGIEKGIEKGIQATIRTCKNFNINKNDTIKNLMKEFSLSEEAAVSYVEKYW